MREIKFRAWNGKKMRYNVNINDGKPVRKGYQWFNESNDVHNSEPMQYTGLKDKNGVEIYENDYVLDQFNNRILVKYEFSLLARLKEIEKTLTINGNYYN